jgi:hypothetical protein
MVATGHGLKGSTGGQMNNFLQRPPALFPVAVWCPSRIAVNGKVVWALTQSMNALAARPPATIVRIDPDTAALKIAAYEAMWQAEALL